MKKIIIIIALLSLFAGSLFAQKQQMAVVSFSGRQLTEDETESLVDLFTAELTKSEYRNDFTLITRNERALTTAYGELNFQRTAMLSESQMGRVWEQLGADWVFYGTVVRLVEQILL